ncbi:MAG: GCAxxG family protein [Firmicutes bacterium]|nr:GCAxxG family protein [Bacillota bacterium]
MSNCEKVEELAGSFFEEGYNCAEAVVRAYREELKLNLSDEALRIATGFGGGIGHNGCICGALTGCIMVINMLQGRISKEESREPAYKSSGEFHQLFSKKFGGACCRVLNRQPFGSYEQRKNCFNITTGAASLLAEYIKSQSLLTSTKDTCQ